MNIIHNTDISHIHLYGNIWKIKVTMVGNAFEYYGNERVKKMNFDNFSSFTLVHTAVSAWSSIHLLHADNIVPS